MDGSEILDRTPPHDLDAEKAILGAILLDHNVLDGLQLSSTDFYADRHRILFDHLLNMPGDQPIDAVCLLAWLRGTGDLETVGGAAYLGEVTNACPSVLHVAHYARLVREASQKRELIHRLSDGLRHLYNGEDLPALAGELVAGIESIGVRGVADRFVRLTCPELDAASLSIEYLVRRAVVAGQPGIIAGPKKSLKTSIVIDLGLSLATGTPFLGELEVPRPVKVAIMSGESGMATIQETARRVAHAKRHELSNVDGLIVSDSLPQLESVSDLDALAQFINADALEVLILDPTYLMMSGEDAGNLFKQGSLLRPLTELGQKLGCTILLVHHTRKAIGRDPFQPPDLEDIAWSGFQEWARQWILLGRRERYEEGTGEHRLWLSCGGSAGHSSLSALTVSEDTPEHIRGRDWRVMMEAPKDAYSAAQDRSDDDRQTAKAERVERDKDKVLRAAAKFPLGETKSALRDVAGISTDRFAAALGSALQLGEMETGEIVKPHRKTPFVSYKLAEEPPPD